MRQAERDRMSSEARCGGGGAGQPVKRRLAPEGRAAQGLLTLADAQMHGGAGQLPPKSRWRSPEFFLYYAVWVPPPAAPKAVTGRKRCIGC